MNLKGTITLKTSIHEAALLLQNVPKNYSGEAVITINYDLSNLPPDMQKFYAEKLRNAKMAHETSEFTEKVEQVTG